MEPQGETDGTTLQRDHGGLEKRLDQLESQLEIERLISGYGIAIDRRDRSLLASLWHDDAVLDLGKPIGRLTGINEILAAAERMWAELDWVHHWQATPRIDPDGDQAGGIVLLDCMVGPSEGDPAQVAGTYFDAYERRDGVWRFSSRRYELSYWTPLDGWKPRFGSPRSSW
jgi:ketosteroid isomerase-like protein